MGTLSQLKFLGNRTQSHVDKFGRFDDMKLLLLILAGLLFQSGPNVIQAEEQIADPLARFSDVFLGSERSDNGKLVIIRIKGRPRPNVTDKDMRSFFDTVSRTPAASAKPRSWMILITSKFRIADRTSGDISKDRYSVVPINYVDTGKLLEVVRQIGSADS